MQELVSLCFFLLLIHLPPLLLLRKRSQWGLKPFFLFLGAMQLLQVISAEYFLVFGPYMKMGIGSALLYPWTLGGVLFVHRLAGPADSRRLVYSLLLANTVISAVLTLSGLLIKAGAVETLGASRGAGTAHEAFVLFWGTFLLYLESLLIPVLFELTRAITRSSRMQVFLPLATCLVLDAFLFPAVAFGGLQPYYPVLMGNLVGKVVQTAVIGLLGPMLATSETPRMTTPLRLGPVLRYLLFELDLQQLLVESYRDPLTHVWNRRYFERALEYEWSRGLRGKSPLVLMTIDLDHLKEINDTCGHAAGDSALKGVAEAIRHVARRESDCAARIGGDEFVLLLPHTHQKEAENLAQRLLDLVAERTAPIPCSKTKRLSISVGVAVAVPDPTITPQDLLRASDEALYRAKQEGRDRWVIAEPIPPRPEQEQS